MKVSVPLRTCKFSKWATFRSRTSSALILPGIFIIAGLAYLYNGRFGKLLPNNRNLGAVLALVLAIATLAGLIFLCVKLEIRAVKRDFPSAVAEQMKQEEKQEEAETGK